MKDTAPYRLEDEVRELDTTQTPDKERLLEFYSEKITPSFYMGSGISYLS